MGVENEKQKKVKKVEFWLNFGWIFRGGFNNLFKERLKIGLEGLIIPYKGA